jgi:serine protease
MATLNNGTYPVQSLWSNAFNSGKGGCVLSYP